MYENIPDTCFSLFLLVFFSCTNPPPLPPTKCGAAFHSTKLAAILKKKEEEMPHPRTVTYVISMKQPLLLATQVLYVLASAAFNSATENNAEKHTTVTSSSFRTLYTLCFIVPYENFPAGNLGRFPRGKPSQVK